MTSPVSSTQNIALNCPTNFVHVATQAGDPYNTSFCVMAYEARKDGSNNLSASPSDTTLFTQLDKGASNTLKNYLDAQCRTLTTGTSSKFALISNAEWMTVARNISRQSGNFNSSALSRGYSTTSNTGPTASTNVLDIGSGSNKRTLSVLGWNGSSANSLSDIWDFAGNLGEFVNVALSSDAAAPLDGASYNQFIEFSSTDLSSSNFFGTPSNWQPFNSSWTNTSNGTGAYKVLDSTLTGTIIRGGRYNSGTGAGIYSIEVLDPAGLPTATDIGFRCVYKP